MMFILSTPVLVLIYACLFLLFAGIFSVIVAKVLRTHARKPNKSFEMLVAFSFVLIAISAYFFIETMFVETVYENDTIVTAERTIVSEDVQKLVSTEDYLIVDSLYAFGYLREVVVNKDGAETTVTVRMTTDNYQQLLLVRENMREQGLVEKNEHRFNLRFYYDSVLAETVLHTLTEAMNENGDIARAVQQAEDHLNERFAEHTFEIMS